MSEANTYRLRTDARADSNPVAKKQILVPRRQFIAGASTVVGAVMLGQAWEQHANAIDKATSSIRSLAQSSPGLLSNAMYVVAHPDDSLIFQSPDLLQNIQNGINVFTVHLTAGDDGLGQTYWSSREMGIEAAYAQMAGVTNAWTTSTMKVGTHDIALDTLTAAPNVTVAFMRLPDGGYPLGTGTALYGFESLMQLAQGSMSTITAVDSSTTYTLQDLINTIAAMFASFEPQLISTLDFVNTYGDGDHMDHYAVASIVQAAHQTYSAPHSLLGYEGYPMTNLAANVTGTLLATKQSVFYTYGAFDDLTCSSASTCSVTSYAAWLQRQYTVGSEEVGIVANAGLNQMVTSGTLVALNGSNSTNVAGGTLAYSWTQTAGTTVSLSSASVAKPTFTAPASPAELSFLLSVTNGLETSTASVTVTVSSSTPVDVAPLATATASSQNTATGQLASSAIDGVISGYPDDTTAEWATVGGGVGSWLKLTWSESYTVSSVVLYDRPNLDDQITSGTLTFSDGTVLTFGALPNAGTPGLTVTPSSPIATTSVLMSVTGVSATTLNVGLSEIEVFGSAG
jgi:LmbE family N-acetylglucosaminyl deacetylase